MKPSFPASATVSAPFARRTIAALRRSAPNRRFPVACLPIVSAPSARALSDSSQAVPASVRCESDSVAFWVLGDR